MKYKIRHTCWSL